MALHFAEVIEDEIRRSFEHVMTKMVIISNRRIASKETIERLLQQIVGRCGVAGHAKNVRPQASRRFSIESFEFRFVHRPLRRPSVGPRALWERRLQNQSIGGHEITKSAAHPAVAAFRSTPSSVSMKSPTR